MKKPKGFFVYFHHSNVIGLLSNEQAGRLIKALMDYGENGELSDFSDDGMLNVTYTLLRDEIDLNFEKYNEVCEKRRQAGLQRAEKSKSCNKYPESNNRDSVNKMTNEEAREIEEYIWNKYTSRFEEQ